MNFRSVLLVGSGQALTMLAGFAGIKIASNGVAASVYGEFAIALSISGIVTGFVFGPIAQGVLRYFSSAAAERNVAEFIASTLRLCAHSVALVLVCALVLSSLSAISGTDLLTRVVFVGGLFGIVSGVFVVLSMLLLAAERQGEFIFFSALDAITRLGGLLVAVAFFDGVVPLVVWYTAGTAISLICLGWHLGRVGYLPSGTQVLEDGEVRRWRRVIVGYSLPFVLFAGAGVFSLYGDRWVITSLLGSADVGYYYAVTQIFYAPANLLSTVVSQLTIPKAFKVFGDLSDDGKTTAARAMLGKAATLMLAGSAAYCFLTFLLASIVLRLVTNDEFAAHSHIAWIVALSQCVFQIGQLVSVNVMGLNKPSLNVVPKFMHGFAVMAFSIWLARDYGLTGIALSTLIGASVYLVAIYLVSVVAYRATRIGA